MAIKSLEFVLKEKLPNGKSAIILRHLVYLVLGAKELIFDAISLEQVLQCETYFKLGCSKLKSCGSQNFFNNENDEIKWCTAISWNLALFLSFIIP